MAEAAGEEAVRPPIRRPRIYRQTPLLHGGSGAQRQSLTAAQQRQEIEALQKQIEETEYDWTDYAQRSAAEKKIAEIQQQIDEKQMALRLTERKEAIAAYDSNRDDPAFQEYVDKGKSGTYSRKEDPLGYYLKNRDMLELQSAIGGAPDSNLREMRDKEQEMYYYLLGSQGSKAAKKYLDDMQILLDQRVHDEAQANIKNAYQNAGWAGKAGLNAMSVPANVFGGITAPIGDVASILSGKGYNPYNEGHSLQDFSSQVRGLTSQDIIASLESDEVKSMRAEYEQLKQKDIKAAFGILELSDEEYRQMATRELELREALKKVEAPFWGEVAANTYQAVMSGADSALGATLFQNGYTAIMGAGTASQRARELWEAGASDTQIGLGAMASGLIEVATEKYSVEYFTQHFLEGDIKGFRDWMTKTLIQGVNEGSEEMASEVANMAANAMILGANSDNQREIRELMAVEGLSREEAEKKAFVNRVLDVLWAGYGGFVSGGAMGGIGGPVNMAVQSQQYRSVYGDSSAELVQQGLESPVGSESHTLAQQYQQKLDSGKKLTGSEIRKLVQANDAQIRTEELESDGFYVEHNSERGTTEVTFAQKPDVSVQSALKENGFKWSKKSGKWFTQASPEQARQTVREVMGLDAREDTSAPQSAELDTDTQNTELGTAPARGGVRARDTAGAERFAAAPETSGAQAASREEEGRAVQENRPFTLSPTKGKTLLNLENGSTEETQITSIASSEKGKLMLNVTGQSEPVPASAISYANADEMVLYHAINSMDLTPAAAQELVKQAHSAEIGSGEFASQVTQMYTLGENGVPLAKAMGSAYGWKLNDTMKEFGYYLGRRVYDAKVQKAEAQKKAVAASQRARAAQDGQKLGGVQYDGITATRGKDGSVQIDGVTLNDQQKSGIAAAELLASMGVNIHIFQSQTDANGTPVGEHGSYHLRDGSIHIDLNAGNDGQGIMAYTIAHELTHFMEQQSPAKFQKFTDALLAELDTDVAAVIYQKAKDLKRQHPDIYKNASRERLMADARSEMVAEGCETMLTDTDAAVRIGQRLQQQDKGIFDKIKQWFRELAGKLHQAYKGLKPDSEIAQKTKKTIQQVDDLVQLWADMAVDAAQNYRTAEMAEKTVEESESRFSFREYTKHEKENWENSKRIVLYENEEQYRRFIRDAAADGTLNKKMYFGAVNADLAEYIQKMTGISVEGYNCSVGTNEIRKILKDHGDAAKEAMRGQRSITEDDFVNIPKVIMNPSNIVKSSQLYNGKPAIVFSSEQLGRLRVVAVVSDKRLDLFVQTAYASAKKGNLSTPTGEQAPINTPKANSGTVSIDNVSQDDASVKHSSRENQLEKQKADVTADAAENYREDSGPYSYESLVSKPDMAVTAVDGNAPNSRADVVYQAKQNAARIGKFNIKDGSVSVHVKDIDTDIILSTNGLKHGLDRRFETNAPVTLKAGEILANSIRINELTPAKAEAASSYVLIGAARAENGDLFIVQSVVNQFDNVLQSMEVLYSINAKKGNRLRSMRPGFQGPVTDSTISISELLDHVKDNFPDVLPEDVLKHYGYDARPDGKLGESALYSNRYSTEAALEGQNEKLKADVANLKELLRLQGETTDGKVFKKDSLRRAANFIMRETGRSLDENGSLSYANADEMVLYHAINSMELLPAAAQELVKQAHSAEIGSGEFASQVTQMYTLGENGVPLAKAMGSAYGWKLNDTMKEFGYYLGRRVYDAKVQKAEAQKKAVAASQRARAAQGGQKLGGVQYDGITVTRGKDGSVEIEGITLNEQQKSGIAAAEMLASMGVNIHVFQSQTDASGKPVGEHGSYHLRDGSIHIDLNAGENGQGIMAYTIAHELTHFMEQQSPAMFQKFSDALLAELETDTAAVIYQKAKELKQQHPDIYKNASRERLMADARSEVVAEGCETMLTDTDAAARIGQRLQQQDESLFGKIRQWFRELAGKLRQAYKGLKPDSEIAQKTRKTIQQVDDLVQLWADMAVDAAENYRTAEAKEQGKPAGEFGETRESFRGYANDGKGIYASNFPKGTPKKAKGERILKYIQDVWSKKPITLRIEDESGVRYVEAKFDPNYDSKDGTQSDASKLMGGNRHGNSTEQRVTLDLADDYYKIASESVYNYSKQETGKTTEPHQGVKQWHYFVNDIYFSEYGETDTTPYRVSINVKEKANGNYFYSFSAEKAERTTTPQTLHAAVSSSTEATTNGDSFIASIRNQNENVNEKFSMRDSDDKNVSGSKESKLERQNDRLKADVTADTAENYREDSGPYSYESLVSKPDMAVTAVDGNAPNSRADVVYQAKQNAARIGKFNIKDGSVSVYVEDIGKNVVLGTPGLKHSLDRRLGVNAPVVLKAGEIIANSIRINEMTAQKTEASESYALIGAARNNSGELYVVRSVVNRFSNELSDMDILYAINAKKEPAALLPRVYGEKSAPSTDSTISIAELLDYVNKYFPDILPESVLKHYGHHARPAGKLGESTLYSDRYSTEADLEQQNEKLKTKVSDIQKQWDEEVEAIRASMKYDAEQELNELIGTFKNQRAAVENRNRTQYRQQIRKMADKFHKMATAPAKADTAHAPIRLVSSIAKFCEIFAESEARAIEFAANALDSRETNMRLMNDLRGETKGRIREADVINRQRDRLLRKSQAISGMKEQYANIQNDPAFAMFYDEHVNQLLNDLDGQLSGTDIYEMNTDQLKQVYNTMRAMMYTITNANRVFSMEKDKTLLGVTRKLAREIDNNKVSHGAFASNVRKYGMWQMRPDTFFNFICGFSKDNEGKAIAKMFSDGTARMESVQRDFYQMFRHLTEAKDRKTTKHIQQMMKNPMKEMIDWGLKDAAGNPVKTTRDMMLQAYMLMNQEDSFRSLVYGGFKLPNAKMYYDGKADNAYGDAEESALLSEAIGESYMDLVHEIRQRQDAIDAGGLEAGTVDQLQKEIGELRSQAMELVQGAENRLIAMRDAIEKRLTDVDLDAIETAKRWYKYTGQLMTDVYLQMYGYKPNLVDGYVPIHRDLTTVKTDIREGEESKAFNLENSGFTKDRVKSVAPILLTGFFQELSSQQQKISKYYGFAQVQKDFNRIWNLRMPGARTTINTKVAAKYGAGKTWLGVSGEQYILNFIQSVAGVRANDDILSKFYGNAASATLSANPRVAVSQLASIPTAAAVVGWKSMAVGFTKGISTSLSTQKKNLLANDSVWFFQRYRGAGGITELPDLKSKGGIWNKIASSAVGKHLFNWCQSMDVFATASMWAMAEDYVQSNGMKQTDEEYKLAVEQCHADIIRQSQPNYTVTERSDMLRDKRGGMKLLTMYKTQSNQNLNILIDAIGEYRAAKMAVAANKNNTTVADLKQANKRLVNGITSVTIGGTLAFVLLRTLVNFALGWVDPYRDEETGELTPEAFGKAVLSEAISSTAGMFALGGQLYDAVNSVVSGDYYYGISDTAVSSLATSAENVVTLLQRLGDPDKDVEWKHIEKALSSTLATCGIPYKNGKRFVEGAEQWYRDLTGGTLGQYTTDASDKQYRTRILRGWQNGDTEKVDDTLALLVARSEKDTDDEVALDVAHGFANSYLKEKVKEGEVLPDDAIKLLGYIGHDDPEGVTGKWLFQMEHPDSELSDAGIRAWNNNQDIPLDLFEAAYKYKGANNRKADVVAYIQGLSVSAEMKRQLWNALKGTWKDKDTPWE